MKHLIREARKFPGSQFYPYLGGSARTRLIDPRDDAVVNGFLVLIVICSPDWSIAGQKASTTDPGLAW
jgi:hypothetical protein